MAEIIFALLLAAGFAIAAGKILSLSLLTLVSIFLVVAAVAGITFYKNSGTWFLISSDGEKPGKFQCAGFGIVTSALLWVVLAIAYRLPILVFFVLWFCTCCKDVVAKFLKEKIEDAKKTYQEKAKAYERRQAELQAEIDAELQCDTEVA